MEIKPRKLTDEEIECVMQYLYSEREPMMIVNEEVRTIGELLRIKRVADGMTIQDLAKQFRITPGVLSEIERNIRQIPRGKEKAIDDYIYKTLYIYDRLEFKMIDDDGDYNLLFEKGAIDDDESL